MNPSDQFTEQDPSRGQADTGRDEFLLRAEFYLGQGLFREAMALARERIGTYPGDVEARLIVGVVLFKTEREKEALAVFEALKEDIRGWARAFEYLGDIYGRLGEMEKARDSYQTFVSLGSSPVDVERLRKKMDSLGEPERASSLSRDFRTLTVAELYLKQGHAEQAEAVLEEIMRTQPGNQRAAELLREARAVLGRNGIGQQPLDSVEEELKRWLRNLKRAQDERP